jgi:predicted transcriptional regulator
MTALTIHIDEKTEARLRKASEEMARDVHDLAECAVSEAVLDYFRHPRTTRPETIAHGQQEKHCNDRARLTQQHKTAARA